MDKVKLEVIEFGNRNYILRTLMKDISCDDVLDSFKEIQTSGLLRSNTVGVITDLRKADLCFDLCELETIVNYVKSYLMTKSIKLAVVGDTPQKIMYPTLGNITLGDNIVPFSSMKDAEKWMMK